ncbi:MAG: hypothetical protein ACUVV4_08365 [Candidatus Bathyarchaeia archaeon]
MKTKYLLLGILLLVIGGGIAFLGYTMIRGYQTFLGQLALGLFPSEQQRYKMAVLMTLGGVGFSLLGLGSTRYGVMAKRDEGERMPSPVLPPSVASPPPTPVPSEKVYCVYCGAENPIDAVFCR